MVMEVIPRRWLFWVLGVYSHPFGIGDAVVMGTAVIQQIFFLGGDLIPFPLTCVSMSIPLVGKHKLVSTIQAYVYPVKL